MAGSLVPLSKVPLQFSRPSNCCVFDLRSHQLERYQTCLKQSQQSSIGNISFKKSLLLQPLTYHRRLSPVRALDSDVPQPIQEGYEKARNFEQWDSLTAKFAGAANIPFLLLQLPQIILNARNLLVGNSTALFAVPWLGMFTGLLGNLSLLSYFIKKRENEVVVVQTLGVVSMYVVITQLAIAGAMPLPHYIATSVVVFSGLVLNFMNYFYLLHPGIWHLWEDFITIAGFSALPQARLGKLSESGIKFVGSMSAWTATLLFMWMPVAQMWTNLLNPDNIKGLSATSMLLAMVGNGLMIPRALLTRDLMCFNGISREFFLAATIGFLSWIGITLWRDKEVYGHSSPLTSLKELVFGP